MYEMQTIIGSNTDSTAFHKKGLDGVATTEWYSTVPFPKEAASLFVEINPLAVLVVAEKALAIQSDKKALLWYNEKGSDTKKTKTKGGHPKWIIIVHTQSGDVNTI